MTDPIAAAPAPAAALPALAPRLSSRRGSLTARFFAWWGRELSALAPGFLRRALSPARPALVASLFDGALTLETRHRRRVSYLGALSELKSKRLRRLKRLAARRRLEVVLAVGADQAVARPVALPLATEATLGDVLYYELDRITPFQARDLYFDYRVARRLPETARLETEVAFAPRAALDPALDRLRASGLPASRVDLRGADGGLRGFNLLPRKPKASKYLKRGLAVGLLAFLAVAGVGASWLVLDAMERRAERLRDEAFIARREAIAAQKQAEQASAQSDALIMAYEMKTGAPLAVDAVALLSEALPDSAWLESLTFEDGRLEMSGVSTNATALLGQLEAAPRLRGAEFRAPITRDRADGAERFVLSIAVLPETVPPEGETE